jgi:hypothetical protein
MEMIDNKYFEFNHYDKIFTNTTILPTKINLSYLGIINSDKGYDYDFYFIQHETDYLNIRVSKKDIYKTSLTDNNWLYWNLKKTNKDLLSTFSILDDYFEKYDSKSIVGKNYVPILREDKSGYPYIKTRLFRKLPDDVLMTKVYLKDFYTGQIEEKTIESFEEFEDYFKQASEFVIFPSKLWVREEDYGVGLRIKSLLLE